MSDPDKVLSTNIKKQMLYWIELYKNKSKGHGTRLLEVAGQHKQYKSSRKSNIHKNFSMGDLRLKKNGRIEGKIRQDYKKGSKN